MKFKLACDECDLVTDNWTDAVEHEAKFPGHWVQKVEEK